MTYVLLVVGGVAGALCRYHGARAIQAHMGNDFPLGTFLINLTGSLVLGMLVGWLGTHPNSMGTTLSLLFGTGFCGAYTTFSSFGFETIQLWRAGMPRRALFNLLSQPILGGAAAWLGLLVGTASR